MPIEKVASQEVDMALLRSLGLTKRTAEIVVRRINELEREVIRLRAIVKQLTPQNRK